MKVCFGIISIGKLYTQEFERLFKPSVQQYCNKYGYDLKVFTTFLDPSQTHPDTISFQKCLVPSFLMDYDLVVILDADIYIDPSSPAIHFYEINDKISIVDEVTQSLPQGYEHMVNIGFADRPEYYYKLVDLELSTNRILNTGVILCNPKIHAEYLKSIYQKYIGKSIGHPRRFHYEQGCIGYELQKDEKYTLLPNVWNYIYLHHQITQEPMQAFFLHLAGIRGNERESILTRHALKGNIRWGIKK